MEASSQYIVGVYSDPDQIHDAAKKIKESGVKIHEVYSPFPIHGIDEIIGHKRTRLPIIAFLFGMTGTTLALTMQEWMMGHDWPMIIGGKNFAPLPSFIPFTFEFTILCAALGMVGTFLVIADLKPYKRVKLMDNRITQDKFVLAVDISANDKSKDEIINIVKSSGAEEVNEKSFD